MVYRASSRTVKDCYIEKPNNKYIVLNIFKQGRLTIIGIQNNLITKN